MSGRASKTQLALPTGIKKLTNIAVVRLKKAGVRFEIACYKNTVVAWRDGFEKDIDNVLQTTQVYGNVSKGIMAKEEDLTKAFGTKDEGLITKIILNSGELQVSEKERKNEYDVLFRDVVTVLVEKCVNPSTNRPYPPGMIERALKEIHFSVDPMRSAKQQALQSIEKLKKVFPIKRAAMRFKFVVDDEFFDDTVAFLSGGDVLDAVIEKQVRNAANTSTSDAGKQSEIVCTADPSAYRLCDLFTREKTGKTGRLEVLTMAVNEGGVASESFEGGSASSVVYGNQSGNISSSGAVLVDTGGDRVFSTGEMASALDEGSSSSVPSRVSSRVAARGPGSDRAVRGVDTDAGAGVEVLYPRGPIDNMPDEYASRRDRFLPLNSIQPGWQVELRKRTGSSVVDAVFFDLEGVGYKAFADARREALKSSRG